MRNIVFVRYRPFGVVSHNMSHFSSNKGATCMHHALSTCHDSHMFSDPSRFNEAREALHTFISKHAQAVNGMCKWPLLIIGNLQVRPYASHPNEPSV